MHDYAMPHTVQVVRTSCVDVQHPLSYRAVYVAGSARKPGLVLWEPIPPSGYKVLGYVATQTLAPPEITLVACVHESMTVDAPSDGVPLWTQNSRWPRIQRHDSSSGLAKKTLRASNMAAPFNMAEALNMAAPFKVQMQECMTLWPTDRSLHAFTVYRAKGALPKGRACIINQRKLLGEAERISNSSLVGQLMLPELQWTLTLNATPILCLSIKAVECTLSGRDSDNVRIVVGMEADIQVCNTRAKVLQHLRKSSTLELVNPHDTWEHVIESWQGELRFEREQATLKEQQATTTHIRINSRAGGDGANITISHDFLEILLGLYRSMHPASTAASAAVPPTPGAAASNVQGNIFSATKAKLYSRMPSKFKRLIPSSARLQSLRSGGDISAAATPRHALHLRTNRSVSKAGFTLQNELGRVCYVRMLRVKTEHRTTAMLDTSSRDGIQLTSPFLLATVQNHGSMRIEPEFEAFLPSSSQLRQVTHLPMPRYLLQVHITAARVSRAVLNLHSKPDLRCGVHLTSSADGERSHTEFTNEVSVHEPCLTTREKVAGQPSSARVEAHWGQSFVMRLHGWGQHDDLNGGFGLDAALMHLKSATINLHLEQFPGRGDSAPLCGVAIDLGAMLDRVASVGHDANESLVTTHAAWYPLVPPHTRPSSPGELAPAPASPDFVKRFTSCGELHVKVEVWKDVQASRLREASHDGAAAPAHGHRRRESGSCSLDAPAAKSAAALDMRAWIGMQPGGPWTPITSEQVHVCTISRAQVVTEPFLHDDQDSFGLMLRSPLTVRNNTHITMQVSLVPATSAERKSKSSLPLSRSWSRSRDEPLAEGQRRTEEVFENQRYQPLRGWGSSYPGHLLPTDRRRYSRADGSRGSKDFPQIDPAIGWAWASDWELDMEGVRDPEGAAMKILRIAILRFGTARQKMVLE
jgi:hypothetical protein